MPAKVDYVRTCTDHRIGGRCRDGTSNELCTRFILRRLIRPQKIMTQKSVGTSQVVHFTNGSLVQVPSDRRCDLGENTEMNARNF